MQFQSGRDSIDSRLPNFRDVHCPIFIMKILIINGYGKSVSGLRSFEQYRTIIRDVTNTSSISCSSESEK